MGSGTLGSQIQGRDRDQFVGREAELRVVDAVFDPGAAWNVLLVHGPPGIGKSAFVREAARRGRERGWEPFAMARLDEHELAASVRCAAEFERPLLFVDGPSPLHRDGDRIWRVLLSDLPRDAVVVVTSRTPLDPGWFEDGWDCMVTELELGPLDDVDARQLLHALGWPEGQPVDDALEVARGYPLALTALAGDPRADLSAGLSTSLAASLVRRIAGHEVDGEHLPALAVAAMTATTATLMAAALGAGHAEGAMAWLATRSFARRVGDEVVVDELLAEAMRRDFARREPRVERAFRRRVADQLHRRALAGERTLTIDLAQLVDNAAIRCGYGWDAARIRDVTGLHPGDLDALGDRLRTVGCDAWWADASALLEEAPEHVAVARGRDGTCLGYALALAPASAGSAAERDPVLGPRLRHARSHHPDGEGIVWRETVGADGADPFRRSPLRAALNVASVLRTAVANPRWLYFALDTCAGREFARAVGAVPVPELTVTFGGRRIECHVADFGRAGLFGAQRAWIYDETGRVFDTRAPRSGQLTDAIVRDAIRNLAVAPLVAESPLASGTTVDERAASVRELIAETVDRAFGDTPKERLLREVLVRGYLEPSASHEAAARELSLSRSAYFRRLSAAVSRVALMLADDRR